MLSGYLTRIFTEEFFADAILFIFAATMIESLVIGGGSYLLVLRKNSGSLTAACGTGAGSA
jgi:hypothetical protein